MFLSSQRLKIEKQIVLMMHHLTFCLRDNLHSLKLLAKTHKGMINFIYIDPPYNTKEKDFMYDDTFIGEDDYFRHLKWLSFMKSRLTIARDLLTENGAVFIQISDIEVAQLKILCDEVFGEENFLNIISVNMKNIAGASGGGEDKRFKKNCEYILAYAKNYSLLPLFNVPYIYTELSDLIQQYVADGVSWKYTSILMDGGEKEYIGSTVDGEGKEIKVFVRRNPVIMSIRQVAERDGITEKEAYRKYGVSVFQTTNAQSSIRTRVMSFRQEMQISDDVISIEYNPKTGKNKGKTYEQLFKGDKCRLFVWLKDTSEEIEGVLYKKDLKGTYWDMTAGMKNLTKEGNVEFSKGKKPVAFIQQIVLLFPADDITVLDFFAGSGTTGHAVMSQNSEDLGKHKFILCTNNESGICEEKTFQILTNVIKGYTTDGGKVFDPNPANLKYYKTDFIPQKSEDQDYSIESELLKQMRNLDFDSFGEREIYQIIHKFFASKYGLSGNKADNQMRMEAVGYKFGESLIGYIREGKFIKTESILDSDMGTSKEIRHTVNTHSNGIDYLHSIDAIKSTVGLSAQ